MAKKWSKCDFKELKKLEKRLNQLCEVDWDQICQDISRQIAQMLLNKVKKRTPVGVKPDLSESTYEYWAGYQGGSLRKAWTVLPIEKHGDCYEITVLNNSEYASYVEYGHRQTPGRYVPALGKSLKVSWVPGKLMLTISEQEVRTAAPELIEKAMYQVLKGVFDGDK